jgi:glycosyltransferase involved in cell wall biosynthesis
LNEKRKVNISLVDLQYVSEKEKKDAFDACDVFVMPSRSDSYGFVYLEAWSRGKPVIGARIGAIPEVIRDGVDGFLVKFNDATELAQKLLLLLKDEALRKKLGLNGKLRVLEKHDLKITINKIKSVYEQVVSVCR